MIADCVHVGEVLRASGGEFVLNQIVGRDITGRKVTVDQQNFAMFICACEIDAVDVLKDVETDGRDAEAGDRSAVRKIACGEVVERSTKFGKGLERGKGVRLARFDEDVKIFGHARLAVHEDCVTADDQILNVVGVEGGQQLS